MEVTYEHIEDPEGPDAMEAKVQQFFDIIWKCAQEDSKKKQRLKREPDGFPIDGHYSCLVCRNAINETNGWYDWYGQVCLLCHKALKEGIVPTFICNHSNSYYKSWELKDKFKMPPSTVRKLVKSETLKARIIMDENNKPYEYIFLKKENPDLIDPDRYTPGRKSYDKNYHKKIDAWSRDLREKVREDQKKYRKEIRNKYAR